MKLSLLLLAAPLLATTTTIAITRDAHAAREIGLGATYDTRAPVGGLRELVPNFSFAGFQAKWDFFPTDALSVGVEGQYNLFQRGVQTNTTPIENGAVTAPTFRFTSVWSFLPTARYYFSTGALRPYAELGTGVTIANGALLVSDLSRNQESVAFILQPSLGVLWRLWSDLTPRPGLDGDEAPLPPNIPRRKPLEALFGLTASVTYAFTTADILGATNVSYAGIQVGIYAKP